MATLVPHSVGGLAALNERQTVAIAEYKIMVLLIYARRLHFLVFNFVNSLVYGCETISPTSGSYALQDSSAGEQTTFS